MFRATRKTLNEVPSLDASTSSLMLQKKGSKSSPATAVPNPGRNFLMSVRSSERMKDKTIRSASPEASRQSHIPVLVRGWIKDSEATRFPTITCGNGSASTLLSIYSISKYAVRFDDSIYDEPSLAFYRGLWEKILYSRVDESCADVKAACDACFADPATYRAKLIAGGEPRDRRLI